MSEPSESGEAVRTYLDDLTLAEVRDLVRDFGDEIEALGDVSISQNKDPLVEDVAQVLEGRLNDASFLGEEPDPQELALELGQDLSTTGDSDLPIEDEEDQDAAEETSDSGAEDSGAEDEANSTRGQATAPPISRSLDDIT